MKREDIYMQLFEFSRPTYYKWKREGVPALRLIEENFTDEELIDYLETQGKNASTQILKNNIEDFMIDDAIFSAKAKFQELQKNIFEVVYNKGVIDILKDVSISIELNEYDIENAKDILIEKIKGYEAKWLSLKNPSKQKLLNSYIHKYFSKLECYAICKYSDNVFGD
jgi:hypothetical protein